MLKTFFTAVCLIFCFQVWAQEADSTNRKDDRYIYLYRTAGGVQVSHYYCFIEDGKQVLVVKKSNTIATMVLEKPNIFELVEKYQSEMLAVKKQLETRKNQEAFATDFKDYNTIVSQLGIQSSFLQYNHFTVKSKAYVAGLKDETTKKGFEIINQLMAVLDKAARAVSEE